MGPASSSNEAPLGSPLWLAATREKAPHIEGIERKVVQANQEGKVATATLGRLQAAVADQHAKRDALAKSADEFD